MEIDIILSHCLKKEYVEECLPFDENTLVFKVKGKMFLLVALDSWPLQINVKCNPERAIELREQFPDILPGYHMNKKHWNTIICSQALSDKQILGWIDDSYCLVAKSLPQKTQAEFKFLK